MKQSKSIAHLRQLCCSGLGKEIVIPEFLRAVRAVLPSGNNAFTGIDAQLNPVYHMGAYELDEFNPELCASFMTPERAGRAAAWFSRHRVLPDFKILDEHFYQSDLYNQFYRPNKFHYFMYAPVTQFGMPAGMLIMTRPHDHKPFNKREEIALTQLLPYLTHALTPTDENTLQYSANGSSGIVIMNSAGKVEYLSNEAQSLINLACQPSLLMNEYKQEIAVKLKLSQLCRNLVMTFQGRDAAPPSWSHSNGRGRFNFRAYWLNPQNHEAEGLIAIMIEHQEPLTLKILRALQNAPLSPVQGEVVVLIAQGLTNDQIGAKLNIKLTTVKDHISKIFVKLDIKRREELLPKLLAMEEPTRAAGHV